MGNKVPKGFEKCYYTRETNDLIEYICSNVEAKQYINKEKK